MRTANPTVISSRPLLIGHGRRTVGNVLGRAFAKFRRTRRRGTMSSDAVTSTTTQDSVETISKAEPDQASVHSEASDSESADCSAGSSHESEDKRNEPDEPEPQSEAICAVSAVLVKDGSAESMDNVWEKIKTGEKKNMAKCRKVDSLVLMKMLNLDGERSANGAETKTTPRKFTAVEDTEVYVVERGPVKKLVETAARRRERRDRREKRGRNENYRRILTEYTKPFVEDVHRSDGTEWEDLSGREKSRYTASLRRVPDYKQAELMAINAISVCADPTPYHNPSCSSEPACQEASSYHSDPVPKVSYYSDRIGDVTYHNNAAPEGPYHNSAAPDAPYHNSAVKEAPYHNMEPNPHRPMTSRSRAPPTPPPDRPLDWFEDVPSPQYGRALFLASHQPTYRPHPMPLHFAQLTASRLVGLTPAVDYLVAWADANTAVAFVKRRAAAQPHVPLVMRFGGFWSAEALRRLYVGCTVRVRAFCACRRRADDAPRAVVARGAPLADFMFGGVPEASAYALQWAVVHQPRIVRSLGNVVEDLTRPSASGKLFLRARLYDHEYKLALNCGHERFPLHQLTAVPMAGTPVVINWVELHEPYCMLEEGTVDVLVPEYMNAYLSTSLPYERGYVFGWIDLTMEESRRFR